MDLPTAKDGFPIVDRHLRWRKGLFVMGRLAELEVGPVSRNISGARMAASRIITSPELRKTMNTSTNVSILHEACDSVKKAEFELLAFA